ncbi:zf-HC2 domain-containing protein [Kitasatospora sp. NPDC001664]
MNHSSPTEPWSGTDHPDVDLLADLAEGLTDPAPAAELRAHLAGCPECTDTLAALDEVSELLGSLPTEELPADVAGRLDAALAAEAAAPVVLPSGRSDARARTRQRSRSPRRPRVPRRVLVGAVLAVLGTGLAGALLRSLPTDGGTVTASSGAAKADTAAIGPDGSGPLFTDEGLAAQVRQLVGTGAPAIAGGKGSPSSRPPEVPGAGDGGLLPSSPGGGSPEASGSGTGAETATGATAQPSCPGLPAGQPLARTAGRYGPERVTALVFPLGPDRYDTYLVTPDCRTLLHRTVPAR